MRRGSLACCRSVSRLEDLRDGIGIPFAKPHFDHCSNYRTDHVLQKPVGIRLNMDLFVLAADSEALQIANGISVVREASFE